MRTFLLSVLCLAGCSVAPAGSVSSAEPEKQSVPTEAEQAQAYVSVVESARSGGLRISAINGDRVPDERGFYLPPDLHKISVSCQLDNGLSLSFGFDVEMKPTHSYCFFSRDEGQACTILYAQVKWLSGKPVTCE